MVYSGDLYHGKDNEKLWNEVKEYIGKQYETEKIYFQSDESAWMKKSLEIMGFCLKTGHKDDRNPEVF